MTRKFLHSLAAVAMVSFILACPVKANAANYELFRNDTAMTCIDKKTGDLVKSRFVTVKGYTYYFNQKGYAHTGWLKLGKDYYFFDASGAMKKKEWVNQYYFKADGKMARNRWITKNIYVGSDGRLIPGYSKKSVAKFVSTKKGIRYRNYDGTFVKKTWMSIGRYWYYFYSNGVLAKNRKIGLFFVDAKGRMVTNKTVRIGNTKYTYGKDGRLQKKINLKKNTANKKSV